MNRENAMRWMFVVFLVTGSTNLAAESAAVQAALTIHQLEQKISGASSDERTSLLASRVVLDGSDGRWWRQLAMAHSLSGNIKEAVAALRRAMALGEVATADGECQIARWLASSNPDAAVQALQACVDAGYRNPGRLAQRSDLASIASRADVREILGLSNNSTCTGVEGWVTDIDYLMSEIRRVHWLYRRADLPEDLLSREAEVRSKLPQLSDAESMVGLQSLMASLKDGHSVLYPIGMKRGHLGHLPLGFWLFDDGLFVVRAEDSHQDLIGREVLAVGGVPTDELLKRLLPFVSHDNSSGYRWVVPVYLTFTEYLEAAGADLDLGLIFRESNGKQEMRKVQASREPFDPSGLVLSLPAAPSVSSPLYLSRPHEAFWSMELKGGVIYAQLNRVADGGKQSLDDFAKELRVQVLKPGHSTLILDVRHNAGGDAIKLPQLVRTLVTFDTVVSESKLYVLTSRNTFSAAQTLLNELERLTGAVFVGEPPGTRPNRFGNEAQLTLPCSGILGALSAGYNQGSTSRDERSWIPPDIPVKTLSEDYFAGTDAVLEVVLKLRSQPPSESRE